MSNLFEHARRELNLIGEEPETISGYLTVIQAFVNMRHSGASSNIAISVLTKLMNYESLSDLTDDPEEWIHVYQRNIFDEDQSNMWQNVRNSEAFSNDGGKTYYLLSEIVGKTKVYHESKKKEENV